MRPAAASSSARLACASDHLLRGFLGVKRTSQLCSSYLSSCPSIQPWHKAASIASRLEIPAFPDAVLNSFSQRPPLHRPSADSQSSNAAWFPKDKIGNPFLISLIGLGSTIGR